MGSPTNEVPRNSDETLHPVTLTRGFWLSDHEVTQAEFAQIMSSNPSLFKGGEHPGGKDHPVEMVTFDGVTIGGCVMPFLGMSGSAMVEEMEFNATDASGGGVSTDPFSNRIPCDCQPQPGDTIAITAFTIMFVDITTVNWRLYVGGGNLLAKKLVPASRWG